MELMHLSRSPGLRHPAVWQVNELAVEWDTRLKTLKDGVTTVTRRITPEQALYWHLDLIRRDRWNYCDHVITIVMQEGCYDKDEEYTGEVVDIRAPFYWTPLTEDGNGNPSHPPPWRSCELLLRVANCEPNSYVLIQTHEIKSIRWTPSLWEHF